MGRPHNWKTSFRKFYPVLSELLYTDVPKRKSAPLKLEGARTESKSMNDC
jgi:hypothetical protein